MKLSDQTFGYGLLAAAVIFPFAAAVFEFDPGRVLLKLVTLIPILIFALVIPLGIIAWLRWLCR